MIDFDRPVLFSVNGEEIALKVIPDQEVLTKTTAERGDPNYQFEAEITYSKLLGLLKNE